MPWAPLCLCAVVTLDLVYNPAARAFNPARLEALERALKARGFAPRLCATVRGGAGLTGTAELICVHGGDGTLRDTVEALGEDAGRVPLCIAPAGTVNLVARELGYARQPEGFARQIAGAWARGPESWVHSPLYRLGEIPVVCCLSIGPDSQAVAHVSPELKRRIGRYAYVAAIMRLLRTWPSAQMSLRGETAEGEAFACVAEAAFVSRGALYAGAYRLSPRAALVSDSVELITLRRASRSGMLAFAFAAMLRLPLSRLGLAEIRSCRRIEFDPCALPVQVDGDHIPDCAHAVGPSGLTLRYVV